MMRGGDLRFSRGEEGEGWECLKGRASGGQKPLSRLAHMPSYLSTSFSRELDARVLGFSRLTGPDSGWGAGRGAALSGALFFAFLPFELFLAFASRMGELPSTPHLSQEHGRKLPSSKR